MIWSRGNCRRRLDSHARKLFGSPSSRIDCNRSATSAGLTAAIHRRAKWRSRCGRRSRCSSAHGVPVIDATECSIEEISSRILDRTGIERRLQALKFTHAWYSRTMIADQWCETSWRAQPGSFVSLMTLYESNFVRSAGWSRSARDHRTPVSKAPSDCDLYLTPIELSRYTSVFRLTYEFDFRGRHPIGARSGSGSVRVSRCPACRSAQLSRISAPSAALQAAVGTQA
jgi:uncharacterized protein YqiB (DUF1249 family)